MVQFRPKFANLLKFYSRAQNAYMQHFMTFFPNADSVHVVKTKIQTAKTGEAIYASLASDKIRLWFRVTVLITLLMPVDKLRVIAFNFAAIKTPLMTFQNVI